MLGRMSLLVRNVGELRQHLQQVSDAHAGAITRSCSEKIMFKEHTGRWSICEPRQCLQQVANALAGGRCQPRAAFYLQIWAPLQHRWKFRFFFSQSADTH